MTAAATTSRVAPIDVLRGLVIAIMSVDHASETFNKDRFFSDSVFFFWKPGTPIPPAQFLTRWMTHLCAPTFVLLAGTALAISTQKRLARGESPGSIDRAIMLRGALIVAIELLWMSPVMLSPGRFLFQVLYAIGGSFICMAGLRRLSDRALLVFALVVILGGEAMMGALFGLGVVKTFPAALMLSGGFFLDGKVIVAYPLVPWLGIMALGWVLGRKILAWGEDVYRIAPRVLAICGASSLALFVAVRGVDGYGNMLHRDSLAPLQWLHVNKYPPSATFSLLELGIAALILAALFRFKVEKGGPLLVYGQVALFYYVLHIHLMKLVAHLFGIESQLGLASAWGGGIAVLVVLYPLCVLYRRYKQSHANALTRLL